MTEQMPPEPTTEELVRQLYEQHDKELHLIFTRMMEQTDELPEAS